MIRCDWCLNHPLSIVYHDEEWGIPLHNDRQLFECLLLEGAQAGLSWITILKKREGYRTAFDGFNAEKIAGYGEDKVLALLNDTGIVRHRLKIHAAITNARCFLEIQEKYGSFDRFIWQFVENQPVINTWHNTSDMPVQTAASLAMSQALRRHGFKFVGATTCYAFMQATGMVNDHLVTCWRYKQG